MTALSRVVISQRERTIALRPTGDGLMAHTLYEDRDLNSPKELFDGMAVIKTDPEMVQLATQLIQRQAGKYEVSRSRGPLREPPARAHRREAQGRRD